MRNSFPFRPALVPYRRLQFRLARKRTCDGPRAALAGRSRPLLLAIVWLFAAAALGADPPRASTSRSVLRLNNGGFVSGALCDSNDPSILRWQGPLFVAPFDFRLKGVDAVSFPTPAELPKPVGEYCFELAGGDMLFGSLLELNAEEAKLDVPLAGRIHVRRDCIRQFSRWKDGAGLVYRGPNGLDDWTASPSGNAWHNEYGQLMTDEPRAFVQGNFALPPARGDRV